MQTSLTDKLIYSPFTQIAGLSTCFQLIVPEPQLLQSGA